MKWSLRDLSWAPASGGGDGLRLDGCGGSFGGVFLTLLEGTVLAEAALREGLARLAGLSLLGGGALGGSGLRLHNGIEFGGCGLDGEGFVPVGLGGLARLLAEGLALLILSEVLAVLSETILPVLALAVLRLAAAPSGCGLRRGRPGSPLSPSVDSAVRPYFVRIVSFSRRRSWPITVRGSGRLYGFSSVRRFSAATRSFSKSGSVSGVTIVTSSPVPSAVRARCSR